MEETTLSKFSSQVTTICLAECIGFKETWMAYNQTIINLWQMSKGIFRRLSYSITPSSHIAWCPLHQVTLTCICSKIAGLPTSHWEYYIGCCTVGRWMPLLRSWGCKV